MKLAQKITHFFFPQESNNQKAKFLHSSSLFIFCLLVLIFQFSLRALPHFKPQILGYASQISVDEVIRLTNEKRAQNGLNPLETNTLLSRAALAKATDMLNRDYWAHVAPDGTEPWSFFINAGYKYRYAGENLARDFAEENVMIEAWMASPTHRENMLSPKYKEIGIAVVEGDLNGVDTTIVVQLFGTKMSDTSGISPVAQTQAKEETLAVEEAAAEPTLHSVKPPVSPFNLTKISSLILVGGLIGVLAVDQIIVSKKKISRLAGRSLAHLAFLGMVLAIVILIRAGQIL